MKWVRRCFNVLIKPKRWHNVLKSKLHIDLNFKGIVHPCTGKIFHIFAEKENFVFIIQIVSGISLGLPVSIVKISPHVGGFVTVNETTVPQDI